jgi:hypothetical protein
MIDIERLRLTNEEYRQLDDLTMPGLPGLTYRSPQAVAEAQLAKALWGIVAWLDAP